MGFCNCSMFCCMLLYVHSSIAIILKRELIALLNLSSWCLVMVERLFLAVPRGCLQFVIVVFPDHTHLLCLDVLKTGQRYLGLPTHVIVCTITFNLCFSVVTTPKPTTPPTYPTDPSEYLLSCQPRVTATSCFVYQGLIIDRSLVF